MPSTSSVTSSYLFHGAPDTLIDDNAVLNVDMEEETEISTVIVEKYVDLAIVFKPPGTQKPNEGIVYDYACEVLSLGLFKFDMKDTVRERDGKRDILLWKYLMLLYRTSGQ